KNRERFNELVGQGGSTQDGVPHVAAGTEGLFKLVLNIELCVELPYKPRSRSNCESHSVFGSATNAGGGVIRIGTFLRLDPKSEVRLSVDRTGQNTYSEMRHWPSRQAF